VQNLASIFDPSHLTLSDFKMEQYIINLKLPSVVPMTAIHFDSHNWPITPVIFTVVQEVQNLA